MDLIYEHAPCLDTQDMGTPQDILREVLAESELSPTEIGRRLGYAHPYQAIHDLISGKRRFTREKQQAIAEILGISADRFSAPDIAARRSALIEQAWSAFLATETAKRLSREDLQLLERVGRQFLGDKLPTVAFFQHVALVLEGGYTTEQLSRALEKNEGLDAELTAQQTAKTSPKAPPKGRR